MAVEGDLQCLVGVQLQGSSVPAWRNNRGHWSCGMSAKQKASVPTRLLGTAASLRFNSARIAPGDYRFSEIR
jgi:hypothetical protein